MIETENTHHNTFHEFFVWWLGKLNANLEHLVSAAQTYQENDNTEDDSSLRHLIDQAVSHYEEYYKTKSDGAKLDVISMFSPTWLTSLEDSLLWIAGWRPTTAIHVLYSKSGIQLEARLADLVPVFNTGDLGDLSLNQLNQIDELQKKTIREERIITEKMAKLQESAADTPMVDLSNMVSEVMRNENTNHDEGREDNESKVEFLLKSKKNELEELLHMADSLRMETLNSVVEILTPIQAVYFLIAAAELHLRLHDWGMKRDAT
uniref:protein DOG1-like 3 n=1 Tax=Erigeron canadensis TaxID=72917 RepID=UPI001CB93F73|nr:protein DOG1-like 3 [Erigeron canadensis]